MNNLDSFQSLCHPKEKGHPSFFTAIHSLFCVSVPVRGERRSIVPLLSRRDATRPPRVDRRRSRWAFQNTCGGEWGLYVPREWLGHAVICLLPYRPPPGVLVFIDRCARSRAFPLSPWPLIWSMLLLLLIHLLSLPRGQPPEEKDDRDEDAGEDKARPSSARLTMIQVPPLRARDLSSSWQLLEHDSPQNGPGKLP